jgi:hypothetical protein
MAELLHQQRLLLELLVKSGNIAVSDTDDGTLLYVTMKECERKGWLTQSQFGAGFNQAVITDAGRRKVKNRRGTRTAKPGVDKRRAISS